MVSVDQVGGTLDRTVKNSAKQISSYFKGSKSPFALAAPKVIPSSGGDSDANGCKSSAGYSWCETKRKCLRPWEEKCDSSSPPVANSSSDSASSLSTGAIAGIAVGSACALLLSIGLGIFLYRKNATGKAAPQTAASRETIG